jgi:hypothetical protein
MATDRLGTLDHADRRQEDGQKCPSYEDFHRNVVNRSIEFDRFTIGLLVIARRP